MADSAYSDFFGHLIQAHDSFESSDGFDVDSNNPESNELFYELMVDEYKDCLLLVEHCRVHYVELIKEFTANLDGATEKLEQLRKLKDS